MSEPAPARDAEHTEIIEELVAIVEECHDSSGHYVMEYGEEPCDSGDLCGARICDAVGCVYDKLCAARAAIAKAKP